MICHRINTTIMYHHENWIFLFRFVSYRLLYWLAELNIHKKKHVMYGCVLVGFSDIP